MIRQLHERLAQKELSARKLLEAHLRVIKQSEPEFNAFLHLDQDRARNKADFIDEALAKGERPGLLTGIPCAVKDNILVKKMPATAGSRILKNYKAVYNATVIERLEKQGALIVGKTNLDAFAMGSSTEHSDFGVTKNAHDPERVPGGSSGGSATACALGEVVYALGSDTGGSIRQPAAFSGVVGLKPTYGAVSRFGLIALASSLDVIGPLAATVEDVEIVFRAIAGCDPRDATTAIIDSKKKGSDGDDSGTIRVGVVSQHLSGNLDKNIQLTLRRLLDKLENHKKVSIEKVSLPHAEAAIATYYIIMPAEASSNLGRYDGIRYGASKKAADILGRYLETRAVYFNSEVKRRVILGTFTLSAGYYDAYYEQAQKMRLAIRKDFDKVFSRVDVLVGPTTPTTAFKIGEKTQNPLEMYLQDIYTVPANLAGLPGLSLPVGKIGKLPVAAQLIASRHREDLLFSLGRVIENIIQ